MTELFNTPFETALRVLLLLESEARTDFSINMIAAVDFAALYGRSFAFSEMNLHGDNLFKFSEFATRKELTRDGMTLLVRRGFVDINPTKNGHLQHICTGQRILPATRYEICQRVQRPDTSLRCNISPMIPSRAF